MSDKDGRSSDGRARERNALDVRPCRGRNGRGEKQRGPAASTRVTLQSVQARAARRADVTAVARIAADNETRVFFASDGFKRADVVRGFGGGMPPLSFPCVSYGNFTPAERGDGRHSKRLVVNAVEAVNSRIPMPRRVTAIRFIGVIIFLRL